MKHARYYIIIMLLLFGVVLLLGWQQPILVPVFHSLGSLIKQLVFVGIGVIFGWAVLKGLRCSKL